MDILIFIVCLALSIYGVYLCVMALLMRTGAIQVDAEIIALQKKTNKGKRLPVVRFDDESGITVQSKVHVIDNMTAWIQPFEKGEFLSVLYKLNKPERSYISGYMSLIAAFFLQWPLVFYVVRTYSDEMMQGRFGFLFVLFVVISSIWLFLRFVRFNY